MHFYLFFYFYLCNSFFLFVQLFMPLSGKHDRTHSANVIIPHVMSMTLLVYSKRSENMVNFWVICLIFLNIIFYIYLFLHKCPCKLN